MEKCPMCKKGELKKGFIEEYVFGINLGKFPAEICTYCNESFTDSKTTKKIEKIAKQKGVWALDKKTKIIMSGNSLAVRIPKKIAEFLKLKPGVEAYIHPENKKLIIEAI